MVSHSSNFRVYYNTDPMKSPIPGLSPSTLVSIPDINKACEFYSTKNNLTRVPEWLSCEPAAPEGKLIAFLAFITIIILCFIAVATVPDSVYDFIGGNACSCATNCKRCKEIRASCAYCKIRRVNWLWKKREMGTYGTFDGRTLNIMGVWNLGVEELGSTIYYSL